MAKEVDMRDSVRWKARASVVVVAALLIGLSVVAAVADTVGTGNFTIDIDINTGSYSGALIFDDSPQVVFGTPVNLGTDVDSAGSAFISGQVTFNNSTSPISGTVTQDVSSDDDEGDSLTFHADGSLVCSPTGCTDGSPGSYVSTVTSISGSVYDELPPGLSYATEGTFSCCVGGACVPAVANNIQHCTGPFALNAFEPVNTVVSPGTETLTFLGSFFDPYTGTVRNFDIDVIFQQVTVAGTTTVAGASNAPGTLPLHVVPHIAHFDALFFDVSTTATAVGDITVCVHYHDADGDGFVDGTAVHETALRFLHHEGDQLVDRTSSNAIFHDKVCGSLHSLSLSALAVSVVGRVPPDAGELACENTAMKSMGRLGSGIVQCHSRAATGTAVTLQECLTDTQQKYGGKMGDTVAKVTALCGPPEVDCTTNGLSSVSDMVQREMESLAPQIFCATAPGAFALKCEARAAKNVAKLSEAVAKCNIRAATSALAGTTKNVASKCENRAMEKYDAGTAKLGFLGCRGPNGAPCAVANLDTVRIQLKDTLESIGVPIYCKFPDSSCVVNLTAVTDEHCVFGF